ELRHNFHNAGVLQRRALVFPTLPVEAFLKLAVRKSQPQLRAVPLRNLALPQLRVRPLKQVLQLPEIPRLVQRSEVLRPPVPVGLRLRVLHIRESACNQPFRAPVVPDSPARSWRARLLALAPRTAIQSPFRLRVPGS